MYSSADTHRDGGRDTHKLQMTARDLNPVVSGSTLHPISKANFKIHISGLSNRGSNQQNDQQQLTRFLVKNVHESGQAHHGSLTR